MKAISVTGLGFGDEGKGHTVAYLATQIPDALIVRYTGGPQAAHNVVTDDGVWHCFSQFGSGTFTPGTRTHLSSQMMIKLSNLEKEAEVLQSKGVKDIWERLTISPDCLLVDPYHAALGQTRELNRMSPHGTVGMGITDAIECPIKLYVRDIDNASFIQDLMSIRKWLIKETHMVALARLGKYADLFRRLRLDDVEDYYQFYRSHRRCIVDDRGVLRTSGNIIFEGSQGTLLDPRYGFHPYTTRGRLTTDMVDLLLETSGVIADVTNFGVIRSYVSRHGYGPFITEDPTLRLIELHNVDSGWQGRFRTGWSDMVALRYALSVNKIDALIVSHWDCLASMPYSRVCSEYECCTDGELEPWFVHEGQRIHAIKVTCEVSELRTSILFGCVPIYRDIEVSTALAELKVPIKMYLTGPNTSSILITPASQSKE